MIGRVEPRCSADGWPGNTYIVFSSDNGLHTGEYRLMPGKLTAFDTDIHVPLVVTGPGRPAGTSTTRWPRTSTWPRPSRQMGGTTLTPATGTACSGCFTGTLPGDWRNAILVEHHGPKPRPRRPRLAAAGQRQPDHV